MRKFVLSLLVALMCSVTSFAANSETAEKQKTVIVAVIGAPTGVESFAQAVLAKAEALGVSITKVVDEPETVFTLEYRKEFKQSLILVEPYAPPNIDSRVDNFKLNCKENRNYKTTTKKQKPYRSARDSL